MPHEGLSSARLPMQWVQSAFGLNTSAGPNYIDTGAATLGVDLVQNGFPFAGFSNPSVSFTLNPAGGTDLAPLFPIQSPTQTALQGLPQGQCAVLTTSGSLTGRQHCALVH